MKRPRNMPQAEADLDAITEYYSTIRERARR